MSKPSREAGRKADLINAAIRRVAQAGSHDVTVAEIAREAGMSPALAHHYFGSKEQMLLMAMRHILREYGAAVRAALAGADGPRARVEAIFEASFGPVHFDREVIAAWFGFYALAQTNADAARLLSVYHRRLRSNLAAGLRPLTGDAALMADALAALIDGLYIRAALGTAQPDGAGAQAVLRQTLARMLTSEATPLAPPAAAP